MKSIPIWCVAVALPFAVIAGCLYDANNRCSEGQRYNEAANICSCASGSFLTENGCITCGTNERIIAGVCQCNPGFERVGGACMPEMADPMLSDAGLQPSSNLSNGEGLSCTSDADCAGTNATFCDLIFDQACIIEGCELGTNAGCNAGEDCCDLSAIGQNRTICSKYGCGP